MYINHPGGKEQTTMVRQYRFPAIVVFALLAMMLVSETSSFAQRRPPTMREFLLQFRGKEILIMDKTGGVEQFTGGEASRAYTLTLNDVQNDYIVVSRESESDKRSFIYPISLIRRIIFAYDGKPYVKIVLEMY
jgi:hypothetical protein